MCFVVSAIPVSMTPDATASIALVFVEDHRFLPVPPHIGQSISRTGVRMCFRSFAGNDFPVGASAAFTLPVPAHTEHFSLSGIRGDLRKSSFARGVQFAFARFVLAGRFHQPTPARVDLYPGG